RGDRLRALLRLAAQDSLPDVLLRGLSVVFENDRIAALPEIARAFSDIADRDAGVVGVAVTVARDVEQYEVQQIEARLRQQIDGDLRFEWKVNPELIGGMVVRYQGKVVDGSLSSRLDLIESKLKG
ncbi:MAG TPA: ATP synthase F1 subunit delta, partial [Oligoflexia bacterium]|nr:ATP synthase F1 subunit delta [Oligoflexia bacterium]